MEACEFSIMYEHTGWTLAGIVAETINALSAVETIPGVIAFINQVYFTEGSTETSRTNALEVGSFNSANTAIATDVNIVTTGCS